MVKRRFKGGVTIDECSSNIIPIYAAGNPKYPVNNLKDAKKIMTKTQQLKQELLDKAKETEMICSNCGEEKRIHVTISNGHIDGSLGFGELPVNWSSVNAVIATGPDTKITCTCLKCLVECEEKDNIILELLPQEKILLKAKHTDKAWRWHKKELKNINKEVFLKEGAKRI